MAMASNVLTKTRKREEGEGGEWSNKCVCGFLSPSPIAHCRSSVYFVVCFLALTVLCTFHCPWDVACYKCPWHEVFITGGIYQVGVEVPCAPHSLLLFHFFGLFSLIFWVPESYDARN